MLLYVALIGLLYTDGTVYQKTLRFYTQQDCQLYIQEYYGKDLTKFQDKKVMELDDKLIWKYKTIKSISAKCKPIKEDIK